jgi:glycosyltransferase involved in cell wall biosynthesis
MGPSRICIVTPGQIGSNPRVVKEAQALHEAGFDVDVIATQTLDGVEPRDQSLMRRIPWRVRRIDLRSPGRWRLLRARQIAFRGLRAATGFAPLADLGFSAFTRPLLAAALNVPANLYIAHYPAALPAVVAAARKHGARYAYDAEDFHLGDWPEDSKWDSERQLVREIEGRHLPAAAYVTAASPGIADALVAAYGIPRPHVVLNVFPLEQAQVGPTPKGTAEPGPSVYWFSQTIGPDRGLECAVRAIAIAETEPHLYLRGAPAPGYVAQLQQIAAKRDAGRRLHFLPPEAPDEMVRLAAAYDIGLCGDEITLTAARRACLTNKLFTFLAAGVPPLLSATPAQAAFASEAGLGDLLYPVNDAATLARLIDRILGSPGDLEAARMNASNLARSRYNWQRERDVVLSLVRSVAP